MSESYITCWIITEGMAGTENQCLGIAEALGVTPVVKRIGLRSPWKELSPYLLWGHKYALTADSSALSPPWPDLLIASGRKSIGAALHVRKASGGKTFLVQVQDPRISAKHFDLVIVPQHDPARGDNVVVTTSALNRVTPEKLAAEKTKWEARLRHLPSPRVAVLIGGNSKAHRMTGGGTRELMAKLLRLKAGLMVTASRRTGEENRKYLESGLASGNNVFFWDGTGENPYFGFLALADHIIVTEDSVSMTSEALATGKPVYIAPMEGGAKRLNLFHKLLREQGFTRPFTGTLETWSYAPPDDMMKVVHEIRSRIGK